MVTPKYTSANFDINEETGAYIPSNHLSVYGSTVEVFACHTCGALVRAPRLHDDWHITLGG
jgi:hypothetical protein